MMAWWRRLKREGRCGWLAVEAVRHGAPSLTVK